MNNPPTSVGGLSRFCAKPVVAGSAIMIAEKAADLIQD